MSTATKRDLVTELATAFTAAKEAALAADCEDDGGTCNFDSPAFRFPRVADKVIQEAANRAGVSADDFTWMGGKRWYWLGGFLRGQAARRSRMSHAATKALREANVAGLEVCEYCQMD